MNGYELMSHRAGWCSTRQDYRFERSRKIEYLGLIENFLYARWREFPDEALKLEIEPSLQ